MLDFDPSLFHLDPWWIALIAVCVVAFITFVVIWGIRAHRHQASTGREDLIGRTAEVKEALQPKGVVFIEGERWTAISEEGRVEPGEEVIISRVDNLRLYVTKKEPRR